MPKKIKKLLKGVGDSSEKFKIEKEIINFSSLDELNKKVKKIIRIPLISKRKKIPGVPPGTLSYSGEKKDTPVHIDMIDFTFSNLVEKRVKDIKECLKVKDKKSTTWINVTGLHDISIIEDVGKIFDIHPLILEDILHTHQRPKVEFHEDYIYFVLRIVYAQGEKKDIQSEQISFIITKNYVITFQEQEKDIFETIRERIRHKKGRIRDMGNDYMAYCLIDTIIDNYFPVLEKFGDLTDNLEQQILEDSEKNTLIEINSLKRELILLRRSIWPLREVINSLHRDESKIFTEQTKAYLRDVHDHTLQVIDNIEALRDVTSGMVDMYLSTVSNKMNEVMKVLTIIATIFIPLTFIAGIYGMNFQYFPELSWRYGYFIVWGIMILVVATMLVYFRKKKWI